MNKASVQNTLDRLFWKIPQHVKQYLEKKQGKGNNYFR